MPTFHHDGIDFHFGDMGVGAICIPARHAGWLPRLPGSLFEWRYCLQRQFVPCLAPARLSAPTGF